MSKTTKKTASNAPRSDLYEQVTASIVASLEAGTRPWSRPWRNPEDEQRAPLPLRANGEAYRGINILLLWGAALDAGYTSTVWMTFKQAQQRGGQVRKGEKGSTVVFAGRHTKTETDEKGDDEERQIPFGGRQLS